MFFGQSTTLVSNGVEWYQAQFSPHLPITLVNGGTGTNLSSTGGTGQYLKQTSTGAAITVGTISASDLPSSIDVTKIGSGAISNTEFGYLNGVTSSIQTQIDSKLSSSSDLLHATNVINVKQNPGPGEYSSISAALASITDNSPAKIYEIRVAPGIYLVASTINLKPYVILKGSSQVSVLVGGGGGSMNLINATYSTAMYDFTLTHGVPSTGYLVYYNGQGAESTPATTKQAFSLNLVKFTAATNLVKIDGSVNPAIFSGAQLNWGADRSFNTGFEIVGGNLAQAIIRSSVTGANATTSPHPSFMFKVHGANAFLLLNSVVATSSGNSGNCVHVYNGGKVDMVATEIQGWTNGIWVENSGDAPTIYARAVLFTDCTKKILIEHTGTIGSFQGYADHSKIVIPKQAPFFITNSDSNIITVAEKGGDYESIKDALDSIADASSTNRYVIQIGPGIFEEAQLQMKEYVTIQGQSKTQVVVDADNDNDDFIIGIANSSIINLNITGPSGSGTSIVRFDGGGLFEMINCVINRCDRIATLTSSNGYSVLSVKDCSTNPGTGYTYGFYVDDENSGYPAILVLDNYKESDLAPPYSGDLVFATGSNSAVLEHAVFVSKSTANSSGIVLQDGATARLIGCSFIGFDKTMEVLNVGAGPNLTTLALHTIATNYDLHVAHPDATISTFGAYDKDKIWIDDNVTNASLLFLDNANKQIVLTGKLISGPDFNSATDITKSIQKATNIGQNSGLTITTSGRDLTLSAGYGYVYTGSEPNEHVKFVEWDEQTVTASANASGYYFINSDGILGVSSTRPNVFKNIIVVYFRTSSSGFILIRESARNANYTANRIENFLVAGIGAIYISGSLVAEGASKQLTVGSGSYYIAGTNYVPTGGTNITFASIRRNGSGDYTFVNTAVVDTDH